MDDLEECELSAEPEKKMRKRLKKLCTEVKNQMEFYFSDANLNKDRFLKKLIMDSDDGYIDINIFAKFNKLKAITDDMSLVVKALSTSDVLLVSEDKRKVKRTKPMSDPKDVDERTVYVECLPLDATHNWVKEAFESCGKVVYVSLPRYQSTGDIKGFGFVEFETVEGCKIACEMMNNPPANAADKIGKFPRTNKQMNVLVKQIRMHGTDLESRDPRLARKIKRQRTVSESAAGEDNPNPKNRKRQRTTSEGTDTKKQADENDSNLEIGDAKRAKLDADGKDLKIDIVDDLKDDSTKRMLSDSESETSSESENEQHAGTVTKKVRISEDVKIESCEPQKTKQKRKRNKKKTKDNAMLEGPELRVISKQKWMSLKKEYLQLQKASMKRLKKTLREHIREEINDQPSKGRQLDFTPDVIVKVTAEKSCSRKDVQEHASQLAEVSYVDLKDEATEGIIRCPNAEQAAKLTATTDQIYSYVLLQGDAEKTYWDKIQRDRDHKFNTKSKPKRGRNKIFKKAEKILDEHQQKHIVFDD